MPGSKPVFKVAIPGFIKLFDYLPPEEQRPCIGSRVRVPFGNRECIAFVIETGTSLLAATQLKPIIEIIDHVLLFPEPLWQLCLKAHRYYHHSIADVLLTGLPLALRKGLPILEPSACKIPNQSSTIELPLQLNSDQAQALQQINQSDHHFTCFLLEGVTGSGKTEVYLQAIAHTRAQQKSVLVLIPEISLTPQTLARFHARFNEPIGLYHSEISPKQRLNLWSAIHHGMISIIIGTRSALFLPIPNVGLIIIDEEHDMSFKQQEGFRYSARDLGVLFAKQQNIPIILGSATPSFESLYNSEHKYTRLSLPHRAGMAILPSIELIDIRHKKLNSGLSNGLIAAIRSELAEKNQVLIFLNRRGYAPTFMCFDCGKLSECDRCDRRFTYHHAKQCLRCHHCQHQIDVPSVCSGCASTKVNPVGTGTEKLEQTLEALFPNTPVVRIDKDSTTKKDALKNKLDDILSNKAQLLIGTQLLAKGHHFPNVTLVAIVDMDSALFSTDFRAIERMGQLMTQVAGRAGRGDKKGKVLMQTAQPTHPLIVSITQDNYRNFAQKLLKERAHHNLPPFSHYALIRASGKTMALPESFLTQLKKSCHLLKIEHIQLLGPIPAPMAKCQNNYRAQLLVQSTHRGALHQLLNQLSPLLAEHPLARKTRWSIDVDPIEMS